MLKLHISASDSSRGDPGGDASPFASFAARAGGSARQSAELPTWTKLRVRPLAILSAKRHIRGRLEDRAIDGVAVHRSSNLPRLPDERRTLSCNLVLFLMPFSCRIGVCRLCFVPLTSTKSLNGWSARAETLLSARFRSDFSTRARKHARLVPLSAPNASASPADLRDCGFRCRSRSAHRVHNPTA